MYCSLGDHLFYILLNTVWAAFSRIHGPLEHCEVHMGSSASGNSCDNFGILTLDLLFQSLLLNTPIQFIGSHHLPDFSGGIHFYMQQYRVELHLTDNFFANFTSNH